MTYLDWFIVVALGGGLVRGLMVGAIRQVASIAGLILSFILAVQLMRPIGGLTVDSIGLSASTAPLVGFVVVFTGVQLVVIALARLLEAAVESLHLSFANRAAGGALGAFKAALILSVLFLITTHVGVPDATSQSKSTLYAPVASVLPGTWDYVAAYLPAMRQASDAFGREVRPRIAPGSPDTQSPGTPSPGSRESAPSSPGARPPDSEPAPSDTSSEAATEGDAFGASLLDRLQERFASLSNDTRPLSIDVGSLTDSQASSDRPATATGWGGSTWEPASRHVGPIPADLIPDVSQDSTTTRADPGAVIVSFFQNL